MIRLRQFAALTAILLVAVTSVFGLIQIPDEFRNDRETPLQMSVAIGAAMHSVLGLVLVIAVLKRRRWAVKAALAWAVTLVARSWELGVGSWE